MEATRSEYIIAEDGELHLTGLPYRRGEVVDVIVLPRTRVTGEQRLTVRQLKRSGIIGIWKDRTDIENGAEYARRLREQAQKRRTTL